MPLFLEFHWETASNGVSDSNGNSIFLSILCSAPGKRRSHWYTNTLHVVGSCLLVCSLKTKSLITIYKQNTREQALKPDTGSQPISCSLRDLLTSLGLSFSISWWREWYIHTLIWRNRGHLDKSRKVLDDTRKLACFSLCRKTRLPLGTFGTHRACALGLIWFGLGVTRKRTWSLAYGKRKLCHWAVPPTLFCSVFVPWDRICSSQAVLELALWLFGLELPVF